MKNNNSINSLDIFYLAKTYVVNGECIKSINSEIDIDKKEIQNRIYNHDNIVIQNEDNIDIYCDIEFLEIFRNIIVDYFEGVRNREDAFFKAYEAGGKVVVGGMTHPHMQPTYYLIARNNFSSLD